MYGTGRPSVPTSHSKHQRMSTAEPIYKISNRTDWENAQQAGVFTGAAVDLADGFIHFSSASQVAETAARHFSGLDDLVLAAIDPVPLGEDLKWETSRGGALFPHLYGALPMAGLCWAVPLPLTAQGHEFPEDLR